MIHSLLFNLLAAMTVVPAILVVLTNDIVRAACWLLLSLAGAAGLFFYLGADFVGATQLMIYVGGTLVLVIFGVMLTATGPFSQLASRGGDWLLALGAGLPMFGLLAYGLTMYDWNQVAVSTLPPGEASSAQVTTHQIGMTFLGFPQKTRAFEPPGSSVVDAGHDDHTTHEHDRDAGHEHGDADEHEHGDPAAARPGRMVRSAGYLLPFEIVSVHLVVVLIGAAYLARAKRRRKEGEV